MATTEHETPLEESALKREADKLIAEYRSALDQNGAFTQALCQDFWTNRQNFWSVGEEFLNERKVHLESNGWSYTVSYKLENHERVLRVSKCNPGTEDFIEQALVISRDWSASTIQYDKRPIDERWENESNNQAAVDRARKLIASLRPAEKLSQSQP